MSQTHIFYSGTVQGVGFRYTVERYAQDFNLKGWVKNLLDGRVELLVEGDAQTITQLCQKIEQHFEGSIDNQEITQLPAEDKFFDFRIVY